MIRYTLVIFFALFIFLTPEVKAQHNPYLDKKAKNKPSAVMAKQNRRDMRKGKKLAKRQMRRSRKGLNRKGHK